LNFAPLVLLNVSRTINDPDIPFYAHLLPSSTRRLLNPHTGEALQMIVEGVLLSRFAPSSLYPGQVCRPLGEIFPWLKLTRSGGLVCPDGKPTACGFPKVTSAAPLVQDFAEAKTLHPSQVQDYPLHANTLIIPADKSSSFDLAVCGYDQVLHSQGRRARDAMRLFQLQLKDGAQMINERMLIEEGRKCAAFPLVSTLCILGMGKVSENLLKPSLGGRPLAGDAKEPLAWHFLPGTTFRATDHNKEITWEIPPHMDVVVLCEKGVEVVLGPENYRLLMVDRQLPDLAQARRL
jgi:hypothetical protein